MDKTGQPPATQLSAATSLPSDALSDPAIPALRPMPLVGRDEELSRLRQQLCGRGNAALTALDGLPGVGKTSLLITLAHDPKLRAHFKDGILWAGLGPHPNMPSHLSRWGSLLGLSQAEISTLTDPESWAIALRRAIGLRTMLLIIDDAWSLEDMLALKVGGLNCVHLVSTRFPFIATEIAAEGTTTISELDSDEGMTLLHMLAPRVVENERQRVHELVVAVGGLPLALNLIGNYLRTQSSIGPDWLIPAALQRLSDAGERLNISERLDSVGYHTSHSNDTPISLRTVIAVTEQHLSESTRHALHTLSVFPPRPNSFSEDAALVVAACTVEALDALIDAGLLEINSSGRYTLHQTIADYARLQLKDAGAHQRLLAYLASFVEMHRKDYDILDVESRTILAALEMASEQRHSGEITRVAVALAPFLLARGLYPTANTHLLRAYNAAMAMEDHHGLAGTLLYLGQMTWKRGDYEQAERYLQEGLEYARKINDQKRVCAILAHLGSISWKSGDYKQAHTYLQEGLMLARQLENIERMCELLQILGSVERMQGNYRQAEASLQEGLQLARQIGERELTCLILLNLGLIAGEQGNSSQAEAFFHEGLRLARQLNHREWICGFMNNLGDSASQQEDYEQAMAYFQEGLDLARQIEHREWISFLLLNLGLTARKQKNYLLSEHCFQESLVRARQIGIPQIICHALYGHGELYLDQHLFVQAEDNFREMLVLAPEGGQDFIALAHYGLARLASVAGRVEEAKQLGKQSIATLENMGRRETREVKSWLCSLSPKTKKMSED